MCHSVSSSITGCVLKSGDEAFQELTAQTLRKEMNASTLTLDPLPSGTQIEVVKYLSKNIFRSGSELISCYGQPVGVLIAFIDGAYRTISAQVP